MSESLNFSDRQTKLFFLAALLSGLAFVFISDERFLLSVLTMVSGEDFPRQGVILFDMGDDSCEYYSLDKYLPAGRSQILQKNAQKCIDVWNASLKLEKLEDINSSTNNSRINELLLNASEQFKKRNWSEVSRIADRLEIERKYSVRK